jgi:AcrR family transcriptional regulator
MSAMEPASGSLRERKKRRTFEALARIALELVAERGLDAVRVEDICERAEVGRSTYFRYFDSKETCFVAGVHQGRLAAVLAALANRPASEKPFTAICNAFLDVAEDWRAHRDTLLLEARIRAESPAVQARASATNIVWETAIGAALRRHFTDAAAAELNARLVAGVAVCAARHATARWIAEGARRSPVDICAATFAAVRHLVGDDDAPITHGGGAQLQDLQSL